MSSKKNYGLERRFYHIMPLVKRVYKRKKRAVRGEWAVYVLRCRGNKLYTGIAKDVRARFRAHKAGKGAAFTRGNPPQAVLYQEKGLTYSGALKREAAIKRLTRPQKNALIRQSLRPLSRRRRG